MALQDETGTVLPAVISIPDVCDLVSLVRLVAITGTRFLRHIVPGFGTRAPVFQEHEKPAARHMFAIINGQTPEQLSFEEIEALHAVCKCSMAFCILDGFGALLQPCFSDPDKEHVRPSGLTCSLADDDAFAVHCSFDKFRFSWP